MPLLAALVGLATPILARVLIALGFSVLTITGVAIALSAMKSQITSALGGAPAAALQLAGLAGAWTGLGMIFGAMTFAVTLWGLTKAVRIGVGG